MNINIWSKIHQVQKLQGFGSVSAAKQEYNKIFKITMKLPQLQQLIQIQIKTLSQHPSNKNRGQTRFFQIDFPTE